MSEVEARDNADAKRGGLVERIIEFSARRRALVLVGVAVALGGSAIAIRNLKLDAIPDLSEPQVVVFPNGWGAARR